MALNALIYLFLAYGVSWLVPLVLLIVILVRLNRLSREVDALRRRLGAEAGEWQATGEDADLEGA